MAVEHRPPRSVHLLVMNSDTDPQSYPQTLSFCGGTRTYPTYSRISLRLGPFTDTNQTTLTPLLDWFAAVADRNRAPVSAPQRLAHSLVDAPGAPVRCEGSCQRPVTGTYLRSVAPT